MNRRTPAQPPAILSDSRGAIMVLGLFFCSILVGGLWYLAGLGDAALFRERAQEASDAVAFTSASVHARGMNILVLINLIMAVILSIRVALKVLLLLETIAAVVFAVACILLQFELCAAEEGDIDAIALTNDAIAATRQPINDALTALSDVEKTIAKVIPGAAIAASLEVGHKYAPGIKLSLALPQNPLDKTLPVVPGTDNYLCKEATDAVGEVAKDIISTVAPPLAPFGDALAWIFDRVGDMAKGDPEYFCELPSSKPPKPTSDLTDAVNKKCDEMAKNVQNGTQFNSGNSKQDSQNNADMDKYTKNGKFDKAACIKDQTNTATGNFNSNAAGANGSANWSKMLPAAPSPNYGNGCFTNDSLGLAAGDESKIAGDPKMVDLGHFNSKATSPSLVLSSVVSGVGGVMPDGFAQAEFFYDCHGDWAKGDCNPGPDYQDAMWHFKWRPRLVFFNNTNTVFKGLADAISKAYELQFQTDFAATSVGLIPNQALRVELEKDSADSSKLFVH